MSSLVPHRAHLSSELPFYVFPDGRPPRTKKKGKRDKVSREVWVCAYCYQVATESGTEETPDGNGQGPSKRSKSTGGMEDPAEAAPAAEELPINGSAPVPTATDADPLPKTGQNTDNVDIAAPPGLENAAPPSKEAQASFASAANGIADAANADGKVVLNGA